MRNCRQRKMEGGLEGRGGGRARTLAGAKKHPRQHPHSPDPLPRLPCHCCLHGLPRTRRFLFHLPGPVILVQHSLGPWQAEILGPIVGVAALGRTRDSQELRKRRVRRKWKVRRKRRVRRKWKVKRCRGPWDPEEQILGPWKAATLDPAVGPTPNCETARVRMGPWKAANLGPTVGPTALSLLLSPKLCLRLERWTRGVERATREAGVWRGSRGV